MNRIILIRDGVSDKERKIYVKTTIFYNGNMLNAVGNPYKSLLEEFHDVTELLVNQIIDSAVRESATKNIYIMDSDSLYDGHKTYSFMIVRYFVNKRKESGDIFIFAGNNRISRLIARTWGFKQIELL